MNIALIVPQGLESLACMEIKEIVGLSASSGNGWVLISEGSFVEAKQLMWRSQLAYRVIFGAKLVPQDEGGISHCINQAVSNLDLGLLLPKRASFASRAFIIGECKNSSMEIASLLGAQIKEKSKARVDLSNPDCVFVCVVAPDVVLVGLDIACLDLAMRPYRLFHVGPAVKAPLAYALVRESGWQENKVLVDPGCHAGLVVIEAALFGSSQSAHMFTKEKLWALNPNNVLEKSINSAINPACSNSFSPTISSILIGGNTSIKNPASIVACDVTNKSIHAAKKNAKIAGVSSYINFKNLKIGDLKLQFAKESVDAIASIPPIFGPRLTIEKQKVLYYNFLVEAKNMLNDHGILALLVKSKGLWVSLSQSSSLHVCKEMVVFQGKEPWNILCFSK